MVAQNSKPSVTVMVKSIAIQMRVVVQYSLLTMSVTTISFLDIPILAICACNMFQQSTYRSVRIYGLLLLLLEIFTVVALKGHYYMDIYAAVATYYMVKNFIA